MVQNYTENYPKNNNIRKENTQEKRYQNMSVEDRQKLRKSKKNQIHGMS